MKAIINAVLIGAAVAGGVFVGQMAKARLAPAPESYAPDAAAKAGGTTTTPESKVSDPDVAYLRFKRQFVIPVLGEEGVESLVLLNIAIALDEAVQEEVFAHEPKFRDAFVRELLQISDAGYFNDSLTTPTTYEVLRETLIRAARDISEKGVVDVLILDLSKQDR